MKFVNKENRKYYLTADIGGTNIKTAIMNKAGEIISELETSPTHRRIRAGRTLSLYFRPFLLSLLKTVK